MTLLTTNPHPRREQIRLVGADVDFESLGGRMARSIYIVEAGGGRMHVQCEDNSLQQLSGLRDFELVSPDPAYIRKILATSNNDAAQVWQIDDPAGTPVYVDETTDFNDVGAGDVDPWPASEAIGDQMAIGYATPFEHLSLTIGTAGVGGTLTWRYWDGSAWSTVPDLVDDSTGFTAGTSTYDVRWGRPSNWTALAINGSAQLYYVVAQVATVYSTNPVLSQGRVVFDTDVESIRVGY